MFFEGNRIDAVREMILADNLEARQKAAQQAAPLSARGFHRHLQGPRRVCPPPSACSIRRSTNSCRTTTPPRRDLATKLGITVEEVSKRVHELHEFNPMLGHRGCRLGITFPEITEMQARAIFEAAAEVHKKGIKVHPEVMIPLVGFKKELDLQVEIVHRVAKEVANRTQSEVQLPGRHDDRGARAAPSPPTRSPRPPSSSASAPTT